MTTLSAEEQRDPGRAKLLRGRIQVCRSQVNGQEESRTESERTRKRERMRERESRGRRRKGTASELIDW